MIDKEKGSDWFKGHKTPSVEIAPEYKMRLMTPEECVKRWVEIEPYITSVLDEHSRGEWTAWQILQEVIRDPNNFHIWDGTIDGVFGAILTTRIIAYNNFTALHCTTVSGSSGGDFNGYIKQLEKEARLNSFIDVVECTGRRGLMRLLKKDGWEENYVTCTLDLREK